MEQALNYGPWGLMALIVLSLVCDWLRDRFVRKSPDPDDKNKSGAAVRATLRELLQKLLDRIVTAPGSDNAGKPSVGDDAEVDRALAALLRLVKRHAWLWEEIDKRFRKSDRIDSQAEK